MFATHAPTTSTTRVRRATNRSDRAHNARAAITAYHHDLAEEAHEEYIAWCDAEYEDYASYARSRQATWPSFPSSIPML